MTGKIINIKMKHSAELTSHPLLSQLKSIDSVLDDILNGVGDIEVEEASEDAYDSMMDDMMKVNMLVGGMMYAINDMRHTELDGHYITECNRLREENKKLKEAVLFHKNNSVGSNDVKATVTELLVEALETLQPY